MAWIGAVQPGQKLASPLVCEGYNEGYLDEMSAALWVEDIELRTGVKIGIALYPSDGDCAEALFGNAEAALKRAKNAADTYLFYSPEMNARVAQHLLLESRLRKAVTQRQLVLHYQTKVDLVSRKIRGLEALIRWNDPEQGLISPWSSYRCWRSAD